MSAHWCTVCGSWRAIPGRCELDTCAACGATQCHAQGLGRGACRTCHYGRVSGWSHSFKPSTCVYKGCNAPVVYSHLPGSKKECCKTHGDAILKRRSA